MTVLLNRQQHLCPIAYRICIDAGMSPAIEVMPENDSEQIFNIAIDSAIEQYAGSMKPPHDVLNWMGGVPDSVKMMIGVTMLRKSLTLQEQPHPSVL